MLPKFAFLALLGLFLASHITTAEDYYRFMHHGHCKDGYVCTILGTLPSYHSLLECTNTKEETIVDCRNTCESLGEKGYFQAFGIEFGYFAYAPGSKTCACYGKDEKCGNDGRYLDHFAFEILPKSDASPPPFDFCSGYCLNGGTCKMENGAPKCSCLSFRIQDEAKKAGNYGVKKYYGTRCQNVERAKQHNGLWG